MTRTRFLTFVFHASAIFLILLVLFVSFTRQALYAPTQAELQARAKLPLSTRIAELKQWPPSPDHPLYPLLMVRDRVRLVLAPPAQKPLIKLEYADARLKSAERLIARGRFSLAMSTITKAEKYVLSAAEDIVRLYPRANSPQHGKLIETIRTHEKALFAMKSSFSDEQRAVIDQLLAELSIVLPH